MDWLQLRSDQLEALDLHTQPRLPNKHWIGLGTKGHLRPEPQPIEEDFLFSFFTILLPCVARYSQRNRTLSNKFCPKLERFLTPTARSPPIKARSPCLAQFFWQISQK